MPPKVPFGHRNGAAGRERMQRQPGLLCIHHGSLQVIHGRHQADFLPTVLFTHPSNLIEFLNGIDASHTSNVFLRNIQISPDLTTGISWVGSGFESAFPCGDQSFRTATKVQSSSQHHSITTSIQVGVPM